MKRWCVVFMMIIMMNSSFLAQLEAQIYRHYETSNSSELKCYADLVQDEPKAQLILNLPSLNELPSYPPFVFSGVIDKSTGEALMQTFNQEFQLKFQLAQKQILNLKLVQDNKQLDLPLLSLTWNHGNLPLKVIHRKKNQALFSMKETPKAVVDILFPLPQWAIDPHINDSILFSIYLNYFGTQFPKGKTVQQAIDQQIDEFVKSYITENQKYYDKTLPDAAFSWERTYSFGVMCNTQNLFCIKILNYAFTGGAHGMEVSKYLTFNLKNGSFINLFEQLNPEKQDQVVQLISKKLSESYAQENHGNLVEAGFFSEQIELSHEIYVTPFGLGFVYQPYEIAPYSFGIIDVFIFKEKILPMLKDNCFLRTWFNSI